MRATAFTRFMLTRAPGHAYPVRPQPRQPGEGISALVPCFVADAALDLYPALLRFASPVFLVDQLLAGQLLQYVPRVRRPVPRELHPPVVHDVHQPRLQGVDVQHQEFAPVRYVVPRPPAFDVRVAGQNRLCRLPSPFTRTTCPLCSP